MKRLIIFFKKGIGFCKNAMKQFNVWVVRLSEMRMVRTAAIMMLMIFCFGIETIVAQSTTEGAGALTQVARDLKTYITPVQQVIYAIAGVVALGGAISVFIKMNNEDQDIKKSIMLLVGSCIFLIAAAQSLPFFFGN
jgi:hypothetical protein